MKSIILGKKIKVGNIADKSIVVNHPFDNTINDIHSYIKYRRSQRLRLKILFACCNTVIFTISWYPTDASQVASSFLQRFFRKKVYKHSFRAIGISSLALLRLMHLITSTGRTYHELNKLSDICITTVISGLLAFVRYFVNVRTRSYGRLNHYCLVRIMQKIYIYVIYLSPWRI